MEEKQIKKKKKKGFTIIELIIVLAVMAIIAAIAIPNFAAVRNNSQNKADVQSAETIKRVVLTLVADGTITSDGKNHEVTFVNNSVSAVSDDTDDKIKEALKDVKPPKGDVFTGYDNNGKPQYDKTKKADSYNINISTTGDVTVTTIKKAAPSNP